MSTYICIRNFEDIKIFYTWNRNRQ